MTSIFITLLLITDFVLLLGVYYFSKKRNDDKSLISEITEERKYLSDLRRSVQEDLERTQQQNKALLKKVTQIATEAEMEVKTGSAHITKEIEAIISDLTKYFEEPLEKLSKKQRSLETLLRKVEKEKFLLNKSISRGEKLSKFFDEKISYQDVVSELEDKKYQDARQMLTRGLKPEEVALELGLNISEVNIIAEVS